MEKIGGKGKVFSPKDKKVNFIGDVDFDQEKNPLLDIKGKPSDDWKNTV